jgi:putative NADH-flavin reductase
MKLLILGATGGIGMELVRQALEHNHAVTAFVRSADKLRTRAPLINVVQGSPLNSSELANVMAGQDAVLSGFGPRVPIAKTDAHLLRDFGASLTSAMKLSGVRRGIVVSTAFLFRDALFPPAYLVGRLFFPTVVADAEEMEATLRRSGLDITIVRPPQLTDHPHTGRFRVREEHLPGFGFKIPRADVADFMLRTAENGAHARGVVGVCT